VATPTDEYTVQRCNQIAAAIQRKDGDLAVGIIALIRADGYPEFADQVTSILLEKGMSRLVAAVVAVR
jgi:hypothetical protein